jgi:lambda family phage portal protein
MDSGDGLIERRRESAAAPREGRLARFIDRVAPGLSASRRESELRLRRVKLAEKMWVSVEREARLAFRGYQGATKKPGYSTWNPGGGSADEDLLDDLQGLRDRSRDIIRNDPHAWGLLDTWTSNIIGSGLRPQARVSQTALGITEAQASAFQKAAEAAFSRFWKRADAAERLSFGELQTLALRGIFESGDVALIPRPDPAQNPSLRLQVVEADRIMTPLKLSANLYLREGVEIDDRGRHVAIHVKQTHPGDALGRLKLNDFLRIPTRDPSTGVLNIYHLFPPKRPDQSRGMPLLAPALLLFRDLSQYFKAELLAAKVAACFALFVTTPDPQGMAAAAAGRTSGTPNQVEMLEPAMVKYLAPGQTVVAADPGRPNTAFDPFVQRILRAIGTSIGAPYEVVSQDFSQTTYTSGRMALTEARRVYTWWKNWFVEKLCQPIYERILEESFLRGELPGAPDFYENFELWTQARWVGPGWTWVDPEKEVNATVTAMANHLTTAADECAARGLDWEELYEQRSRELKKAKEEGLVFPPPPAGGAPAPPEAPPPEKKNATAKK